MKHYKIARASTASFAALLMMFVYNNCGRADFGASSRGRTQMSGNGDYYAGKPGYYNYVNSENKCSQLSEAGNPFPNRQIFIQQGQLSLVRDNCQDIEPRILAPSEATFDPITETITYMGQSFAARPDLSEFDLTKLACPNGRTSNGNSPINLYQDHLNLEADSWNWVHPSIRALLFGSWRALPRFIVKVTDPDPANQVNWKRVTQLVDTKAFTQYGVQFVLQRGNTVGATIQQYEAEGVRFNVWINLTDGTTQISSEGIPDPTVIVAPLGDAFQVTIFFQTSGLGQNSDLGFAPWDGNVVGSTVALGSYTYGTAAKLYEIDQYCAP